MSKLKLGALAAGFVVVTAFSAPAFAIGNSTECEAEGGSTVANNGKDYCLIPIRDEQYRTSDYDGNQLGVSDCPGDTLNDGKWCMIDMGATAKASNGSAGLGSVVGAVTGGGSSASSGLGSVVGSVTGGGSSASSSGLGGVVGAVTGGGSKPSSGLDSVVGSVTGGGSSASSSGLGGVVGAVAGGSGASSGLGAVVGGVTGGGTGTDGIQGEIATGLVKDRLTGGNKSATDVAVDLAKKKGEDALKDQAGSVVGGLTGN